MGEKKFMSEKSIFLSVLFALIYSIMLFMSISTKAYGASLPETPVLTDWVPSAKLHWTEDTSWTDNTLSVANVICGQHGDWEYHKDASNFYHNGVNVILLTKSFHEELDATDIVPEMEGTSWENTTWCVCTRDACCLDTYFSRHLENYDGIYIDEIAGQKLDAAQIDALRKTFHSIKSRGETKDKIIAVTGSTQWLECTDASSTGEHKDLMRDYLNIVIDYVDLLVEWIYSHEHCGINSSSCIDIYDLTERVEGLLACGDVIQLGAGLEVVKKTTLILGAYPSLKNSREVFFANHFRAQLNHINTVYPLTETKGVGIYAPLYNSVYELEEMNQAIIETILLKLRLKFDEGSGSIVAHDSSASGANGNLVNHDLSSSWMAGRYGNALAFDGIDDYVEITGSAASLELSEFTYAAWIKPETVGKEYQQIIGKNSIWARGLFLSYGNLCGYVLQATTNANAIKWNTITAGTWQHVAMTYKDDEIRLFLNGQELSLDVSTVGQGAVTSLDDHNLQLSTKVGTQSFEGLMDDVRVYSQALSAKDIERIVYESNLALQLRLDEKSGSNVAYDSSRSNLNGNLMNINTNSSWVAGKYRNALAFDGVNDYVEIVGSAAALELPQFTYLAWIKPSTVDKVYQQIIGKDNIWARGLFLSYGHLRGHVLQATTNANAIKWNTITTGTWQHVAMTYKDGTIALFLNGKALPLDASTIGEGALSNLDNVNLILSSGQSTHSFLGLMDDVRVYTRALTPAEIADLFHSDLVLRLSFDEEPGNVINPGEEPVCSPVDSSHACMLTQDTSVSGLRGILVNSSTSISFDSPTDHWTKGIYGNGMNFCDKDYDTIQVYVEIPYSDCSLEFSEFSYTAWIKPSRVDKEYQQIIGKDNIWARGLFLSYGHLRGHVLQATTNAHAIKWNTVTAGTWQHVAMTYKDGTIALFLNGQKLPPDTSVNGKGAVSNLDDLNIVISNGVPAHSFDGVMDEVRVYSHALTEKEIEGVYQEKIVSGISEL